MCDRFLVHSAKSLKGAFVDQTAIRAGNLGWQWDVRNDDRAAGACRRQFERGFKYSLHFHKTRRQNNLDEAAHRLSGCNDKRTVKTCCSRAQRRIARRRRGRSLRNSLHENGLRKTDASIMLLCDGPMRSSPGCLLARYLVGTRYARRPAYLLT